ncbi:MAG: hypothetical protein IKV72_05960, partial [Firmicutes bacterium]|nr:hypothetical protein [Bacillota bacterium]
MKRKIGCILIALVMSLTCIPFSFAAEAAADGEVPTGYTAIYTKEDLKNMQNDLSGKYILMNDITFVLDDFVKTTEDPDRRAWVPVGPTEDAPFTGEFNGNGHTISGLISVCYNKELVAGLFGYLKGNVYDLNMVECMVSDSGERGYKMFVGAVAGVVDGGSVTNCSVSGDISSLYNCGGIAGKIINNAVISGCSSSASVTGDDNVAGIVGYGESSSIQNSHNTGEINLIRADYNEGENSAGIIARGFIMEVANCSNSGNMHGEPYYSGGIAGYMTGKISDSYNTGLIYARIGGGIAGYLSGEVTGCYNNGYLRNKTIGGIVGTLYGDAYNCYNTGKIESSLEAGGIAAKSNDGIIKHCYNTGEIIGNNSGGMTGIMRSDSTVEESYNAGLVWGNSDAGGIAGVMNGGSVTNAYNTGVVHAGDKWCDSVGGIAGSAKSDANIKYTYNLGSISRRNAPDSAYSSPLGMIVGYYPDETANVTDNYVHVRANEADFLDEEKVVIEDGQILTTKAMKQAESFAGFDFGNVWVISDTGNYPFPQLKSVPMIEEYDCGFNVDGIHVRDLDIQMGTEFQYTKKAIEPEIVVKDGDKLLTANQDYSVEFLNNIDAGTATAKITGMNGYEGSTKKTFEITPKPYDDCKIQIEYTEVTYNGGLKEPEIRVFDADGEELQITKDFVTFYEFWPEYVGNYIVQVVFKGNYSGETELPYKVLPRAPKS